MASCIGEEATVSKAMQQCSPTSAEYLSSLKLFATLPLSSCSCERQGRTFFVWGGANILYIQPIILGDTFLRIFYVLLGRGHNVVIQIFLSNV